MTGRWFWARWARLAGRCRRLVLVTAVAVAAGACGPAGHGVVPPTAKATPTTEPSTVPSSTTTMGASAPEQVSGARTVLSPVGLNVRAHPARGATIVGTAAQGTELTVMGGNSHGWLEVKGATVTGWISDRPTLSAPGRFSAYTAPQGQFGVLYPVGWTYLQSPPARVVFRVRPGPGTVVVTATSNVAVLGRDRSGYRQIHSEQIVVCGVTSRLDTFMANGGASKASTAAATAQPYLAQVVVRLDAKHALGIDANLADLSPLPTVRDFVNSATFPFHQCEG